MVATEAIQASVLGGLEAALIWIRNPGIDDMMAAELTEEYYPVQSRLRKDAN